jgi:hypothetical protein
MSANDLCGLLDQARKRNTALSITGMLLYKDQSFMQLIEGPAYSVKRLFNSIKKDPRHTRITLISEKESESRIFKEWSMGFVNLEGNDFQLDGFVDYFANPTSIEDLITQPADALELFTHFRMNS